MWAKVVNTYILVLGTSRLKDLRFSRAVVAIGADAVELEAHTCRARPCICRSSIALDLSATAAFTCSHYCKISVSSRCATEVREGFGKHPVRCGANRRIPLSLLWRLCSSTKT